MNRKVFLDNYKGIAIIGVLLIHTRLFYAFNTIDNRLIMELFHSIFSFAVPLFIFITGYILSNIKFKINFKRYLVPYLIWSVIIYILYFLYNNSHSFSTTDFLFRLITFTTSGQYYFLFVLFISFIFAPFLVSITKNYFIVLFFFSLISNIFSQYLILKDMDILLFERSILYLNYFNWIFYFVMGLKYDLILGAYLNKVNTSIIIALTISFLFLDYLDYRNVYKSGYDYFTWQSFCYSILLILMLMKLKDVAIVNTKTILTNIGKLSFPIFLIHNLSFPFLKLSSKFLVDNIISYICLSLIYGIILTFIVVYLSEVIFGKRSIYLFGKIYFRGNN
ncbi:acyltransferase family protein [Campylobacter sp. MOP7]|uniref:acyltransferase family protein n=1 Tax=Campylobacter canis TaxID=3378588 RepID=UPI00387E4B0A